MQKELSAVIIFFALLVSPIQASEPPFSDIYVVGDSLADQGNLFDATEALTGAGIPADDNYVMGRFSNGEVYTGLLATELGLVLTRSFTGVDGNNFAYGGTRTDYNRVEDDSTKPFPVNFLGQGGVFPEDAYPWTVDTQREAFGARGISDPDALYLVFSGSNDLADLTIMVAFDLPVDQADYLAKVIEGIRQTIAAYVAAGARDILVPNLPNLGVVPLVTVNGPQFAGLATLLTSQYNQALDGMLAEWDGVVNIIPFDTFSFLTAVVADPAAYGFTNASEGCYTGFVGPAGPDDTVCEEPDDYVFWDAEHPTTAFHTVMAGLMYEAITLDILDDLARQVSGLDLTSGIKTSLSAKLSGAERTLTDGNPNNDRAATSRIRAFTRAVNTQSGKKIPEDTALDLIERAEQILSLLD